MVFYFWNLLFVWWWQKCFEIVSHHPWHTLCTSHKPTLNDFLASWVLCVFSFLFVHWTHLFYLFFYVASKYYYVLFLRFYNLVCMYIFTLFHLSFWTCVYNFLFLCLSLFIRFSPPSLHTFVSDEKVIQTFLRSVYHRITVTICEKNTILF